MFVEPFYFINRPAENCAAGTAGHKAQIIIVRGVLRLYNAVELVCYSYIGAHYAKILHTNMGSYKPDSLTNHQQQLVVAQHAFAAVLFISAAVQAFVRLACACLCQRYPWLVV